MYKIMSENKKYIKSIQEYAQRNPMGLWQDNPEAAASRKWMRENAPEEFDKLFLGLSEEQKRQVPERFRTHSMNQKGGSIQIKPENKGKFTASAQRAGMGVQEYARHVLANKDKYSSTQVKRANFARNSKKFKHQSGGSFADFFETLPENQRDSTNYNLRRFWELNNYPKDFKEAISKDMYILEDDGLYHAPSVQYNQSTGEYEFMKSMNHPTVNYELEWFWNDQEFKKGYYLTVEEGNYKYKPYKHIFGETLPAILKLRK